MKYRETDITLVKTSRIYRFKDFIPHKNFLYIKILGNNKIISCYGDILKKIFKKKNKKILNKDINELKYEFFNDYIFNLKERSAEDCGAYQFVFEHKDSVELFSCSIYPCIIFNKCKSFDVVIRRIVDEREYDFIELL